MIALLSRGTTDCNPEILRQPKSALVPASPCPLLTPPPLLTASEVSAISANRPRLAPGPFAGMKRIYPGTMGSVAPLPCSKRCRASPVNPKHPSLPSKSRFHAMSGEAGNSPTRRSPRVPTAALGTVYSSIGPVAANLGADRPTRGQKYRGSAQRSPPLCPPCLLQRMQPSPRSIWIMGLVDAKRA